MPNVINTADNIDWCNQCQWLLMQVNNLPCSVQAWSFKLVWEAQITFILFSLFPCLKHVFAYFYSFSLWIKKGIERLKRKLKGKVGNIERKKNWDQRERVTTLNKEMPLQVRERERERESQYYYERNQQSKQTIWYIQLEPQIQQNGFGFWGHWGG